MQALHVALVIVGVALPPGPQGAGLAHNANFVVSASDQSLADEVLTKADYLRARLAKEWLGEELPPSVARVVIHVRLSDAEDTGRTLVTDTPERQYHMVWLATTKERALGSTLAHEITHTVLATQFAGRLPAWADEGAASLQDDQERMETRRRIIDWFARTNNWPDLKTIFDAPVVIASDQATYSVAASLTDYLISRGDKAKFLRFAIAGKATGWDQALQEHYGMRNMRELQAAWQIWACQRTGSNPRGASTDSARVPAKPQQRR